jgi:hypothetical protein
MRVFNLVCFYLYDRIEVRLSSYLAIQMTVKWSSNDCGLNYIVSVELKLESPNHHIICQLNDESSQSALIMNNCTI